MDGDHGDERIGGGEMSVKDRGFASMSRERQREIASLGGRAAQRKGTGHQWTADEAKAAGRKGGREMQRRRREEPG